MKNQASISILLAVLISITNADMTLTVNGLDASNSLQIEPDVAIIISVFGADDSNANYSVICQTGGMVEALHEPNVIGLNSYVFTFEDQEADLAAVNLTTGYILDYQLILCSMPDANTVVFGIDSDTIEKPELVSVPNKEVTQVALQFHYDPNSIVPYAKKKEQEKEESLKYCPAGQGLIPVTEALSAKESRGRELPPGGGRDGSTVGILSVIDISSDITSNQIWTADNTYHIITDVNVQALLVIEPGTIVEFAADKAMLVNNGGTLISAGTPNEPVIYTSDSGTPGYADYYCPMYIEETASSNTKVMYSYVEYAYIGLMVLNKKLETDIQNNYFYNNAYGIVEFGTKHTDIRNNLAVASYYSGVEVFLGDSAGEGSSDSSIIIEDNTCDYYQDNGIKIHGVEDFNEAGVVVLANNIVSGSYQYGLALVDDYMYATVTNTGYFDNANNKNWAFDEDNPAYETILPYVAGTGTLPVCYLRQDCNFINTGSFFIERTELIGKTTDVNSFPDSNYIDIGFHYPNWNFSNPGSGDSLSADYDDSLKVDFRDFAILASGWQTTYDITDIETLASQWLQNADPNIEVQTYGDPNEGYVDFGVSGFTADTMRIFLLIDGQYIREMPFFYDSQTLGYDISTLGDGLHYLKAISVSTTGKIVCSNLTEKSFDLSLNYCILSETYQPNKPLYFAAYNGGAENITVKAYANGGSLVWSQACDGNNIFGSIPAEITEQYEFDYISFDNTSGQSRAKKMSDPASSGSLEGIQALIILPAPDLRWRNWMSTWRVQKTFKDRGIKYKKKAGKSATYDGILAEALFENIKYIYILAHGNFQLVKRWCSKNSRVAS